MGQRYTEISGQIKGFIERQKIFFIGTAACDGRVNISPKGMDSLRILNKNRVVWLNLTGSGNETAAHLLENDRMTIMFCSFEGEPMILRLYGYAKAYHPRDAEWDDMISLFPPLAGARQIIDMKVDLVQTSCGAAVPCFEYKAEREQLIEWIEKKGEEGIKKYWDEKNRFSIDGKPTKISG
ncbi:MAG: pyridoxamine 5'-phosphate oxidase family protein [Nitrospirae bacterium]|nr:pyridoxamine 5'-phosphate oxidase family protein [Nitrospirota bacterium]